MSESGLNYYTPLPKVDAFHESTAFTRLIRGGNRSGRSVAAAAEVASACLGTQIRLSTGEYAKNNYPDRPLSVLVVGYDWNYIGRNLYRLLFQSNVLLPRMGRHTPPLIPDSCIESVRWHSRILIQPEEVILSNGTKILFESSMDTPACCNQYDLVWADDVMADENVILEAQMRLLDRGGKLIWSSFPTNGRFKQFCLKAAGGDPRYHETVIRMDENPHIPQSVVAALITGLTDRKYRSQVCGEFVEDDKTPTASELLRNWANSLPAGEAFRGPEERELYRYAVSLRG